MLDVALQFLVKELNTYLLVRTGSAFGQVELGKPVDDNGKWAVKEDHVGVAVVNLEEERTLKAQLPEMTYVNGRNVVLEPQLRLNLHVLFATNFKQYDVALKYLAHVLTFFQAHPGFTREQYPALDARIEKLTAELLTLTYEQLNQMWAFIGGKQLPSVIYRVRLVALQDLEPTAMTSPITEIEATLHSQ